MLDPSIILNTQQQPGIMDAISSGFQSAEAIRNAPLMRQLNAQQAQLNQSKLQTQQFDRQKAQTEAGRENATQEGLYINRLAKTLREAPQSMRAGIIAQSSEAIRAFGADPSKVPLDDRSLDNAIAATTPFAQPEKPELTSDIKEYQLALSQGYKGSFVDYQTELKQAGSTRVNNTVNAGQDKFSESLGKEAAKSLIEKREKILEMVPSLNGIQETRALLDKGIITGTGANFRVSLGKALNTLGINYASDEVRNSEAFVAAQAKQVASIITAFGAGTGLSDADREFAIKAAGGDITMTEESIRRILDINERAIKSSVRFYNSQASQVPENIVPYSLTVDLPGQSKKSTQSQQPKRLRFNPQTGRLE